MITTKKKFFCKLNDWKEYEWLSATFATQENCTMQIADMDNRCKFFGNN